VLDGEIVNFCFAEIREAQTQISFNDLSTTVWDVGCKPTKAIARMDSNGIWQKGEKAQQFERQEIEEVR
jgi:hypothetical protein